MSMMPARWLKRLETFEVAREHQQLLARFVQAFIAADTARGASIRRTYTVTLRYADKLTSQGYALDDLHAYAIRERFQHRMRRPRGSPHRVAPYHPGRKWYEDTPRRAAVVEDREPPSDPFVALYRAERLSRRPQGSPRP